MLCIHAKRILSFAVAWITLVTAVSVSVPAQAGDEYDLLREKWVEYLTGGDYLDKGAVYTAYIQPKIRSLNSSAQSLLSTMAPAEDFYRLDYIWADRKVGDAMDMTTRSARNLSYNFRHLETLALAYRTKGCQYEGNKTVAAKIIAGLRFMYDVKYNENVPRSDRKNANDNWYEWEIRAPEAIENTLALMYDDIDQELIDNLQKGIDKQVPGIGTAATGANRMDNCLAAIVGGIVQKNPARIKMGTDAIATEMDYATVDDGFYQDGSFIQHHQYPYNASYGTTALSGITDILFLLEGSSVQQDLPDIQNVYQWIYDSFEPLHYEGRMLDSVRGRGISRSSENGYALIESVVMLAQIAPEPHRSYYKSLVKRLGTNNTKSAPYNSMRSIYTTSQLAEILNDDSISPREDLIFYKNFGAMDRAVSSRENYLFNVSMYSDRIRNYESINGENLQSWHTAAGMTYLYNDEITQYDDAFWATVDRHRLPGTTVVKGSESANALYGDSFAGGVGIDDQYGVNGMRYTAPSDAKGNHDLTAQKAWFMFDDEVAALGSGITSTMANDEAETIIDNHRITTSTRRLSVNGNPQSTTLGTENDIQNARWAHLEGNPANTVTKKNTDIGYYFPDPLTLHTKRERRTDSWKTIGTSSGTATKDFVSLAVDHGKKPSNDGYSYVLLPGRTEAETKSYSENPDIEIIANNEHIQAVCEKNLGITGAVIWDDQGQSFGNITCQNPAAVMVKETEDTIKISISDPTQRQQVISLDLHQPVRGVRSIENGMLAEIQGDTARVTVNVTGSLGGSYTVEFDKHTASAVPDTPTGLTAEAITPEAINLRWDETGDGSVTYYPIFSETKDGRYAPVPNYNGTGTSYIHQKLNPKKTYYYKLAAGNAGGISNYSEAVFAATPAIPSTPAPAGTFREDFEGCVTGPFSYQTGFTTAFGNGGQNDTQIVEDADGNHQLQITAQARETKDAKVSVTRKLIPLSADFVFEGDFTIMDSGWKNLAVLYSGNTVAVQIYASEGSLHTYNGTSYLTKHPFDGFTVQYGVPFRLRVEVDMKAQMFAVFVNGTELTYSVDEPLTFRNRVRSIDRYETSIGETRGTYLADNLFLGHDVRLTGVEVRNDQNIPVTKITSAGTYTVRPSIQVTGAGQKAVCITAVKEGDTLIAVYPTELTLSSNQTPEIKINIDDQHDFQNVYLECYLWEDLKQMTPLSLPISFGR